VTSINQSTRQRQLMAFCLTALIAFTGGSASAQEPSKPQADDVLRVNTDLVQTAITVFDKNGRFVDDLDRAQFELTVDGKPRPVSFFERVTAGSAREAVPGSLFLCSPHEPQQRLGTCDLHCRWAWPSERPGVGRHPSDPDRTGPAGGSKSAVCARHRAVSPRIRSATAE